MILKGDQGDAVGTGLQEHLQGLCRIHKTQKTSAKVNTCPGVAQTVSPSHKSISVSFFF